MSQLLHSKLAKVAVMAFAALPLLSAGTARASSHQDAPLIVLDPAANTTDVYAFRSASATQRTPPPMLRSSLLGVQLSPAAALAARSSNARPWMTDRAARTTATS